VDPERREFLVPAGAPQVRVLTTYDEPACMGAGRVLFDASPVWRLRERGSAVEFSFTCLAFAGRPYKTAVFTKDFRTGTVHLAPEAFSQRESVDPLEHPLDELLVASVLARGHGVELHTCGVVDPVGVGHLFVGVSGAGKTTMARLWASVEGSTILNDDRVIVRRSDGRLWMHGTPWHGEGRMAVAGKHPLDRIHFLKKAPAIGATRLGADEAVARLVTCCFAPFYSPEGMDFTLGFLAELAREIPCQELRVVPGPAVVDFVAGYRPRGC
jgi:hypothetical protein